MEEQFISPQKCWVKKSFINLPRGKQDIENWANIEIDKMKKSYKVSKKHRIFGS